MHGNTESLPIYIPAIGYPDMQYDIQYDSNNITILKGLQKEIESGVITYTITSALSPYSLNSYNNVPYDRLINTTLLPKGIYVISLFKDGEYLNSKKFIK